MPTVEVEVVIMVGGVSEPDAQQLALGRSDRGAGHGAVVRPRIDRRPVGDLDLLLGDSHLDVADRLTACRRRGRDPVEMVGAQITEEGDLEWLGSSPD